MRRKVWHLFNDNDDTTIHVFGHMLASFGKK